MKINFRKVTVYFSLLLFLLIISSCGQEVQNPVDEKITTKNLQFELTLSPEVQAEPYTGRVYVMINPDTTTEPRLNIGWFNPPPIFAKEVEGVQPGNAIVIGDGSLHFPVSINGVMPGTYSIQAVARVGKRFPNPGRSPHDLYSKPKTVTINADTKTVELKLTEVVQKKPFQETNRIKLVTFKSDLLSDFHNRPYTFYASVALPEGYDENPDKSYPVVYYVTGFGGSHYNMARVLKVFGDYADNVIIVLPDARNYWGHSVFANSENTGPWGSVFIEELIPLIQKKYRTMGGEHRYVTGISSGGWGSLWLQVTYPEAFNGVWSVVPDPVDFRDFQNINLYKEGANMYVDENGDKRPLARSKGEVIIWYKDFVGMETVMGPGGQIRSFEAVFSPRGEDGKPVKLFNRETGEINIEVAETWKKYDINLILKNTWDDLAPKLEGKLHIFAGSEDTFYLDGAVVLLKHTLDSLGSNAEVKVIEGMIHEFPPDYPQHMFETIYQETDMMIPVN